MKKYHYADKTKPYVVCWTETGFTCSREPDPNDEWDAGDTTGSLDDYGVSIGLPNKKSRYYEEEKSFNKEDIGFMPSVGDVVYLVIESYDDGCTFGHTFNRHHPMHLFKTYEKAVKWTNSKDAKQCQDSGYFGGHNEWIIKEVVVR